MKKLKNGIKRFVGCIIKIFWIFPVDNKKIILFSFQGKQFSDSPKYLSEYIKDENKNWKIYWAFKDVKKFGFLSECGYKLVKFGSIKYFFHFMTSKIIITNDSVESFLPVRKKQIFLNTWHGGSPLKTCGLAEASASIDKMIKVLEIYEKKYTAYLSSSKFMTEDVFKKSFNYHGLILEFGMPRNAILLKEHSDVKDKVYDYFNIEKNKLIVLYAPTFRDSQDNDNFLADNLRLDIKNCKGAIEDRFGVECCFLFRAHHRIRGGQHSEYFISATDYPDMQELLCAAGILITDYSSCMGDMALMYKPVFLYAPDLESYMKNRGFYWDIHTLPFSVSETNEDLVLKIRNFDKKKYQDGLRDYFDKIGSVESVDSIEKTCQWLFQMASE